MANDFKRFAVTNVNTSSGASASAVYTVPAGAGSSALESIVIGITIANTSTAGITASVFLDNNSGSNDVHIVKNASKILGPHGLITQISNLLNKKSINLFNFRIKNLQDYHHQKISFSEWYSNMGIKFIFLNDDVNKSLRKITKFI